MDGSAGIAPSLKVVMFFFYEVGRRLGIDRIAQYATQFGLGSVTGVGLGERSGLIPTEAWKQRVLRQVWVEGETLSCAIGQGYVLVTPLQMARVVAAVAAGGKLLAPRIVLRVEEPDQQRVVLVNDVRTERNVGVPSEVLQAVREAMVGVVEEPGGTGYWARMPDLRFGGKTGTAQVIKQKERGMHSSGELADHAWFVAFAPVDHPRIAVAVLVEHGGHGSSTALPIARKLIKYWHDRQDNLTVSSGQNAKIVPQTVGVSAN